MKPYNIGLHSARRLAQDRPILERLRENGYVGKDTSKKMMLLQIEICEIVQLK